MTNNNNSKVSTTFGAFRTKKAIAIVITMYTMSIPYHLVHKLIKLMERYLVNTTLVKQGFAPKKPHYSDHSVQLLTSFYMTLRELVVAKEIKKDNYAYNRTRTVDEQVSKETLFALYQVLCASRSKKLKTLRQRLHDLLLMGPVSDMDYDEHERMVNDLEKNRQKVALQSREIAALKTKVQAVDRAMRNDWKVVQPAAPTDDARIGAKDDRDIDASMVQDETRQ